MTREQGLQHMMQNFQDSYQRRAAALQEESQDFWAGLEKRYGFSRDKVIYVATPDAQALVPVQMRLAPPQT